jgi:hypothetical protein
VNDGMKGPRFSCFDDAVASPIFLQPFWPAAPYPFRFKAPFPSHLQPQRLDYNSGPEDESYHVAPGYEGRQ